MRKQIIDKLENMRIDRTKAGNLFKKTKQNAIINYYVNTSEKYPLFRTPSSVNKFIIIPNYYFKMMSS
jgi:hypothetical protein